MVKVDCRGLACPIPVLKTKEALEKGATELLVIVDNKASRENVKRFALKEGCSVEVEERDGLFYLKITKQGASAPSTSTSETKKGPDSRGKKSVTVLIALSLIHISEPTRHSIVSGGWGGGMAFLTGKQQKGGFPPFLPPPQKQKRAPTAEGKNR
ncbi:sulfurtransferase TusA family protein [Thermovibrio ammonificans]